MFQPLISSHCRLYSEAARTQTAGIILHRYIFRQVLLATIIAVGLFVFVLVAGNILREVLGLLASGRLGWGLFAYLLAILIPGVIPYALPLGLLFATLLVLGRLSAQSEILAMKAAGLSLWRICAPILLLAVLGTVLAVIIGFYYAPLADSTYRQTLANIVRQDPIRFIQPRTFIDDFPGFVIYVDSREGGQLRDFSIWEFGDDGKAQNFVQAETGEFTYAEEEDAIILTLRDGTGEKRSTDDPENFLQHIPVANFESLSLRLPLEKILGQREGSQKLSLMTLDQLLAQRRDYLNAEQADAPEAFEKRIEVQTALQKKLAFSFSVLSLCIFAIPLGIKASRSETYANFAIALALAMSYFMLTIVVSWLEKRPALRPDLLIWLPNFIFQALGFTLLWRANRH